MRIYVSCIQVMGYINGTNVNTDGIHMPSHDQHDIVSEIHVQGCQTFHT